MNAALTEDTDSLRRYFHEEIDRLPTPQLVALRQTLLDLKLRELSVQLDEAFEADHAAGRLSAEKFEQALREFRAAHPYA